MGGWARGAFLAFYFATSLGRQMPSWLFPVMLGVYLFFTLLWCAGLFLRFRKPKDG